MQVMPTERSCNDKMNGNNMFKNKSGNNNKKVMTYSRFKKE